MFYQFNANQLIALGLAVITLGILIGRHWPRRLPEPKGSTSAETYRKLLQEVTERQIYFKRALEDLIWEASDAGMVLTIENRPIPNAPLAMGAHYMHPTVRPQLWLTRHMLDESKRVDEEINQKAQAVIDQLQNPSVVKQLLEPELRPTQ